MAFYVELDASDCVNLQVSSNNKMALEAIWEEFSFEVPGAKFSKAYKAGNWDGFIHMFNHKTRHIYRGLMNDVHKLLKKKDYGEIRIKGYVKNQDETVRFTKWIEENTSSFPFVPDDYQVEAALCIINSKRRLILSPTSSGKTFIQFLAVKYMIDYGLLNKLVMIVPRTQLVNQTIDEFLDFGMPKELIRTLNNKDKWDDNAKVILANGKTLTRLASHRIKVDGIKAKVAMSDIEIGSTIDGIKVKDIEFSEVPITVSTWQTVHKITDQEWYDSFDGVFVDEVHGATGDALKGIMERMHKASTRIGVTATLKEAKVDALVLIGLFGRVHETVTTAQLIEMGRVARPIIRFVTFDYGRIRDRLPKVFSARPDYQTEIAVLNKITARDNVIFKLLDRHQGVNRLVMFRFNEVGRRLYNKYCANHPDENVFFIDGGISTEDRVRFAKIMDEDRGCTLFASQGTTSTGVSIKNIDVGILAAPTKSKITVLQTIGRFLRISATKTYAIIYDLADDLNFAGKGCFCMSHAEERYDRYAAEMFDIEDEEIAV